LDKILEVFEKSRRIIPSYGRRRSHGLSDTQKDSLSNLYELYGVNLPENTIDPRDLFGEKFDRFVGEIGFGGGERLIAHAVQNPHVGFIGCDPFENGVANALKEIENRRLKNVKIFNGDARFLLDRLKNQSLYRIYVLFPDPWSKRKHHKRRLLSAQFISDLTRKIIVGGHIVVATDHRDYLINILQNLSKISNVVHCNDVNQLSLRPSCLIGTKYEENARLRQKKRYYLRIFI
jgi:tRNA (guanine-N(7)-)-methyltransferase